MGRYEFFDHTADAAMRVIAPSPETLFESAAIGMFDLMTDIQSFRQSNLAQCELKKITFTGENFSELLMLWMRELLFLFSSQKKVPVAFEFETLTVVKLSAAVYFLTFQPAKHVQKCEVKAVTYHQFDLKQTAEGWESTLIFDI